MKILKNQHLFLDCAIPKFQLIFWCRNFLETHSSRRVSGESPEYLLKLFPRNSDTQKLGEISIFYAAKAIYEKIS